MKNFPTTDIILKNILFYTYFSHLYHSSRMFRDFSMNTKKKKKKLSNSYLSLKEITRITIFRSIWNFIVVHETTFQLSR